MKVVVEKFGGSILQYSEDYRRVAKVIAKTLEEGYSVVAVVSAMKGVTDALTRMSKVENGFEEDLKMLAERHRSVLAGVAKSPYFEEAYIEMTRLLDRLSKTLWAIRVIGEVTPRVRDYVLSFGEQFSAITLWATLLSEGIDAEWLTGGEAGIVTDNSFSEAHPLLEESRRRVRGKIPKILSQGKVAVVTGFIAESVEGHVTTLGRGGSDYTATLLASFLDASEIRFYTNVEGVLSANPEIIPEARTIEKLCFEEIIELSYIGAKKFHPRTFEPLKGKSIPAKILSIYLPQGKCTLVYGKCGNDESEVKAVVTMDGLALVNVKGATMVGRIGTAAEVMHVAKETSVNISAISQPVSETVISVVVRASDAERFSKRLVEKLKPKRIIEDVEVVKPLTAVVTVGCGLRRSEVVESILKIASKYPIHMFSKGLEDASITFLTNTGSAYSLAKEIHDKVIL